MSHKISIKDNVLHLQYLGEVTGLQIIQAINDPDLMPNLAKVNCAFFDFSGAQEVNLTFDEVKSFGTIGKAEANFLDDLHVVIILSGEAGRARAQHYVNAIGCKNWKFDLVLDIEEAWHCIKETS